MSKRKHDHGAVGILDSTLGSMLQEHDAKDKALDKAARSGEGASFISCRTFNGRRPGFKFQMGPKGVGYYLDSHQKADVDHAPGSEVDAEPQEGSGVEAIDPLKLLEEAERAEAEHGGAVDITLDVKGIKRLVLGFEKKLRDNLEARMKYMDHPERFMDSEIDLDQEVKKLHALATAPQLYPELVKVGAVPSLLNLLSHENNDIAADAVLLLQELTDGDAVEDHEEEAQALVAAMLESNALELLVQGLTRFDESQVDEAQAIFNIMGIVENLVGVRPQTAEDIVSSTKFLPWLLKRVAKREFTPNRMYSAEILSILLQSSTANQLKVGESNGVDTLLQCVASYKNRDPGSAEEEEMMENLFGALCSVVLPPENKHRFVKAEGVELMILILKQKGRLARAAALKVLDFSVTQCPAACERFVDVLGLKTAFSAFMGKGKGKKGKGAARREEVPEEEEEDRVASLVANLFAGLSPGSRWDRLAAKFVENEHEKVDRLIELFVKNRERIARAERRMELLAREEELDEDEVYLARLDGGLFGQQQVASILGSVWGSGDPGIRGRVLQLTRQQGLRLAEVRAILREHADNVGEVDGAEGRARQQEKLRGMAAALREEGEDDSEGEGEGEERKRASGGGQDGEAEMDVGE